MNISPNIDKTNRPAPVGIEVAAAPEVAIEVEIVDDDGNPIDAEPAEEGDVEVTASHDENLALVMPEAALVRMASELEAAILNDLASRSDWETTYKQGLTLLGLHNDKRTEPWPGACGVYHPLLTEATVRFQAELTTETFPASGPVRTKILGKETPEKKEAAARVEEDMNHQLTDVMSEYRAEHERMLWSLPGAGSAFKKIYEDPTLGRPVSMFVPAEDIILPYGTTDLFSCNRMTQRMRRTLIDIKRLQAKQFYRDDIEVLAAAASTDDIQEKKDKETGFSALNDDRPELYEVHADLILADYCDTDEDKATVAGDGELARPYVVTLVKGASQVLGVRRNWAEGDELAVKGQHFVHYQYVPGFGAYGFGLFHLVGGYAHAATSLMRQLVDAGTLSNLPGGYKTKGLRIEGDTAPIRPGEWRDVHVGAGTLRDNLMPLPYKEPSVVLAGLLDKIIEDGRRMAATADIEISDMSSQAPVGTTLALLERTLKVMTAVQARCHYVLKQEFGMIAKLIGKSAQESYDYDPSTGDRRARKGDFQMVDILPVSDPNAATLSQRVVQYQAALQMAETAPQIYNLQVLHREMLEVLGIKNAAKILPMPEDMKPRDPITENMMLMKGEPIKAFILQDHTAHMAVHQMLLQDPQVQAAIGQNPKAQMIQAALMAHIAEHAGYQYRLHVSQQLGMPLPDPEEYMDPEMERKLSPILAQAAQQALMQNQKAAQQQAAAKQAEDPAFALEKQKLAQKDKEIALKGAKIKGDLAVAADKVDLEERRVALEEGKAEGAAVNDLANFGLQREAQDAKTSAEGIKLGQSEGKTQ